MEQTERKYGLVYNLKVAGALMQLGYRPKIENNKNDPRYFVFKFKNTEEFENDFNILLNEHKLGNL